VIDPARLSPRLELEIHRRVRTARRRFLPLPRPALVCDAITVRAGDLAYEFAELAIHLPPGAGLPPDEVTEAFRQAFGVRPVLAGRLERAIKALETLETSHLAETVQHDREVTVLLVEEGRVALVREEAEFRLPVRRGAGEEACRDLLRTVLGSPEGRLGQLGLVGATATRPALEVWVARRVCRAPDPELAARIEWFSPAEVVARAGSPVLRDPRTLAALTLAGRSADLPEWSSAWEGSAAEAAPTEEVRAQRRSFMQLAAVQLPGGARKAEHGSPDQYFNVHLSLLEFNARVLALAEDPGTPLLARIRFLAIFASNLDEFFMIRVGGLKRAVALGKTKRSLDGLTPEEQLNAIGIRVQALLERQRRCFRNIRERDLPRLGIAIRQWAELSAEEREELQDYFELELLPLLTPKAITLAPGHPFPKIESRSLNLAVMIRDPHGGPVHYVSVTLPDHVPQLVRVGNTGTFIALEDLVAANIGDLHPGRVVECAYPFRLTRLGDLELDESAAADLAQAIQEEVNRRGRAPVVRIELDRRMPQKIRERLEQELHSEEAGGRGLLGEADVFEVDGLLNLGALRDISDSGIATELDYPSFVPAQPFEQVRSIFDLLDERDVLVHHPYDSFEGSFERFLSEAADDPDVVAIKLTLYRPGRPSEIGEAIHRAAGAGKDVTVFVELKARFDEQQNLIWVRQLERAGIHLVTGLVRYKTHAKIALVVRRKGGKLRRYAHIGTGNYNRSTARVYTDLGLFTADEAIGADLQALFNELTGSSRPPQAQFRQLLVAPTNMLPRVVDMIEREIAHAEAGRPARIRMKMNALVDAEVITALYRASQAGVEIDTVVRGTCALRPGVLGLSERIRVVSILGRFLEHARIYEFGNGGDPEYYIGSADLRPRNLRHRVEVITPVLDAACRARLASILDAEIEDPTAWVLNSDGSYGRAIAPTGVELAGAQERRLIGAAEGRT
jgi:polyphosphate kinase